jgi:hypothetical protein
VDAAELAALKTAAFAAPRPASAPHFAFFQPSAVEVVAEAGCGGGGGGGDGAGKTRA